VVLVVSCRQERRAGQQVGQFYYFTDQSVAVVVAFLR
jgi:hypothetical protein